MGETNWAVIIAAVLGSGGIGGVLVYLAAPGVDRLAFKGKDRQDAISVLQGQLVEQIKETAREREEAKAERSEQQRQIYEMRVELKTMREAMADFAAERVQERHDLRNQIQIYALRAEVAISLLRDMSAEIVDMPLHFKRQIERLAQPIKEKP